MFCNQNYYSLNFGKKFLLGSKIDITMILEVSNSYHYGPEKGNLGQHSENELQEVVLQLMKKQGIDTEEVKSCEDGVLDVNSIPSLKLHSLMLQAEEMGLNIKYTKKTLIEIG